MNISVSDQMGVRKVSVLGAIVSNEDAEAIISACATYAGRCEISFFDAREVPAELISGLAGLLQAGHPLQIYTYEIFLTHSLARLGLPIIQVESRHIQSRHQKVAALVIGGSAESLAPLLHLIEHLPRRPVALFIAQHILADRENLLDQLLQVRTAYRVVMPTHLLPIQPGTIYIAPPGHHMKVAHGRVYLTRDSLVQFARPSLDVLFESVAAEYGEAAVAVVLCGYGTDGVQGSAAIRRHGGRVVVEDYADCRGASLLPEAVQAKGVADWVLGRAELTCFLASLIGENPPPVDEPGQRELHTQLTALLVEAIKSRYGYDFSDYQSGTVERRVSRVMSLLGAPDFFTLQFEILANVAVFELFLAEMSVAVSDFFRHPQQFRVLREEVLPYLNSFPVIKIWSAGCATGEEIYSLAILLDELGMLEKSILFATDMNPYVLRQAEAGLFPRSCLEKARSNYLNSGAKGNLGDWIENLNSMFLRVSQRLRRRILFHRHSLVHDGVFNEFQLILCRNVLIYFKPNLQREVVDRFSRSLHRDGFLMLGPSEQCTLDGGESLFLPHNREHRLYRFR